MSLPQPFFPPHRRWGIPVSIILLASNEEMSCHFSSKPRRSVSPFVRALVRQNTNTAVWRIRVAWCQKAALLKVLAGGGVGVKKLWTVSGWCVEMLKRVTSALTPQLWVYRVVILSEASALHHVYHSHPPSWCIYTQRYIMFKAIWVLSNIV